MIRSLRRALAGVRTAARFERNMRIHICVAAYVILFGALAGLEMWAWAACLVCIGSVFHAESHNTSIERLCDFVSPEYSEQIRVCKDAAAGGVLLAAALSAAVGAVVFLRADTLERLWDLARRRQWLPALPLLLLIPCGFFIRGKKTWKSKNQASR